MTVQAQPQPAPESLAPDLLQGAAAIARFLFGSDTAASRRRVYHLVETSKMPIFRLGSGLCARPSVLLDWIKKQERNGARCARTDELPERAND